MRSKELRLVEKNHATVKPDWTGAMDYKTFYNLCSSVASRGMKTYSERRIELRNLQIFNKENAGKIDSQFLSSEQPREPKGLDAALKITRVKNTLSENVWLRSAVLFEV